METANSARERLAIVIKLSGLKQFEFAREIGISNGAISHITSPTGRQSEMTENIANRITQRFPELNLSYEWLMTGAGNMYQSTSGPFQPSLFDNNKSPQKAETHDSETPRQPDSNPTAEDAQAPDAAEPQPSSLYSAEQSSKDAEFPNSYVSDSVTPYVDNERDADGKRRKLERIVMFYSDGTFVEYVPQK